MLTLAKKTATLAISTSALPRNRDTFVSGNYLNILNFVVGTTFALASSPGHVARQTLELPMKFCTTTHLASVFFVDSHDL